MVKENKELMAEARESLSGNWGLAIGTFLVYGIIISSLQFIPVVGSVLALFIAGPMLVGVSMFSLSLSRGENARLEQIFEGFKNYGTVLGAYLLMVLFIFLWMLLLIIPGIIAAIAYSQTFYILAEDDTIGSMDALKKSKEMMDGYKWKYFCLGLRFIGWALLCILTLGIGFLWLSPYIQISYAKFYEDIKAA
ncbi:DUF975 family protein [Flavobacteriaceae bacterium]|jgi:uncharacterized membrane protein|nr:DUF975 family protein [Flavobacteriaceae bacterium]MDB4064794.1 DUF975 family protein [Flavobacteriaceae bacterium]MDB4207103.1 DUF975 family protein [Flavobacteriaceae bacterium]